MGIGRIVRKEKHIPLSLATSFSSPGWSHWVIPKPAKIYINNKYICPACPGSVLGSLNGRTVLGHLTNNLDCLLSMQTSLCESLWGLCAFVIPGPLLSGTYAPSRISQGKLPNSGTAFPGPDPETRPGRGFE